ncbi:MAG TPA: hypothetical protein PKY88_05510 [Anaerohalosphaeraceae bacterium]|nr:hypothetical protein [Anaerohalosphaeraceae bacterium]
MEGQKKKIEKADGSQYNPNPYARESEGPRCPSICAGGKLD